MLKALSTLRARHVATAAVLAATALSSQAQTTSAPDRGYLNLEIGRSNFSLPNGTGIFANDSRDTSYKVAYGWNFMPFLGAELGFLDAGKVSRGGGETKARAAHLSLVASVPVGPVSIFGKAGGAYSQTDTSSQALSGVQSGKASGWGPTYGGGVSMNVTPALAVVAEWERYKMHFAGIGKDDVAATNVGVRLRF